jgi:hypothetical protein
MHAPYRRRSYKLAELVKEFYKGICSGKCSEYELFRLLMGLDEFSAT